MNNKVIIAILSIALVLVLAWVWYSGVGREKIGSTNAVFPVLEEENKSLGDVTALIQNGTFPLGSNGELVSLKNGTGSYPCCGDEIAEVKLLDVIATDIDNDGDQDAIVILTEYTGGTGNFRHLIVFKNEAENMRVAARTFLGDRVRVESVSGNKEGLITLNLLTHGSGEGLCCPNTPETWNFKIGIDGKLSRIGE